jgi:hypothetical protein
VYASDVLAVKVAVLLYIVTGCFKFVIVTVVVAPLVIDELIPNISARRDSPLRPLLLNLPGTSVATTIVLYVFVRKLLTLLVS